MYGIHKTKVKGIIQREQSTKLGYVYYIHQGRDLWECADWRGHAGLLWYGKVLIKGVVT